MSKFKQNQAAFRDLKQRLPYRAPPFEASTGKLNSDGTVHPNPAVGLDDGFVWVRRKGERAETRAYAGKVRTDIADIPVLVAQDNITGELTVVDIRSSEAVLRFGGAAAGSMYAQPAGELFRVTIDGRNIKPGRIRVWIPGTLKVNAEAFWYNDTARARVRWTPTDASVLNLAGNVPAAVGSVNQQRWVVIALNPNATTPALVAFNGTAVPITQTLLRSSIASISVTAGYTKLAAVALRTGDSDESDITDTDWEDLRPWVVDVNYSAITGVAITNSTIDSSVIGGTTPAAATVTDFLVRMGSVSPQIIKDGGEGFLFVTGYADPITQGGTIVLRRSEGTEASPTALVIDDVLGAFEWRGMQDNGAFSNFRAALRVRAAEAWTTTTTGTYMQWLTTPIGSATPAVGMVLHDDMRLEINGTLDHDGTHLGFRAKTPVAVTTYTQNFTTATRTVNAYTTDAESAAYTGIDNAQAGTVYAKLTDLNALRVAYENLRASYDNLLQVTTARIDDDQAMGIIA